ncbi:MAG: hypothetical protein PHC51_00015 [bacterium]|nr:hypothetical protein [bacterium]
MNENSIYFFILGVLFLLLDAFFILIPTAAIRRELRSNQAKINKAFGHYESQMKVLSQHALDYMNSISIEAQQSLRSAQATLTAMKTARQQMESKLREKKHEEALTFSRALLQLASYSGSIETVPRQLRELHGWHINMKGHLNKIGAEIQRASNEARKIGIKSARATDTSQNLTDLGLDLE